MTLFHIGVCHLEIIVEYKWQSLSGDAPVSTVYMTEVLENMCLLCSHWNRCFPGLQVLRSELQYDKWWTHSCLWNMMDGQIERLLLTYWLPILGYNCHYILKKELYYLGNLKVTILDKLFYGSFGVKTFPWKG